MSDNGHMTATKTNHLDRGYLLWSNLESDGVRQVKTLKTHHMMSTKKKFANTQALAHDRDRGWRLVHNSARPRLQRLLPGLREKKDEDILSYF